MKPIAEFAIDFTARFAAATPITATEPMLLIVEAIGIDSLVIEDRDG